jgi:hypothetical protein
MGDSDSQCHCSDRTPSNNIDPFSPTVSTVPHSDAASARASISCDTNAKDRNTATPSCRATTPTGIARGPQFLGVKSRACSYHTVNSTCPEFVSLARVWEPHAVLAESPEGNTQCRVPHHSGKELGIRSGQRVDLDWCQDTRCFSTCTGWHLGEGRGHAAISLQMIHTNCNITGFVISSELHLVIACNQASCTCG